MIHFVGAGPGAVDLITVRGQKLLKEADVIIYAGSLVNPQLLQERKANCEVYDSAYMTLEEVIAVMEQAECQGKETVRLHTGDPSIYGAIREQMDLLEQKGITYESWSGCQFLLRSCRCVKYGIYVARNFTKCDFNPDGRCNQGAGGRTA